MAHSSGASTLDTIRYITAAESQLVDDRLMGPYGYTLEQLMELAGLSVAEAVNEHYKESGKARSVLVVAGPGNNGGDGLVAARHLKLFGWEPIVVLPKASTRPFLQSLVKQLESFNVPVLSELPGDATVIDERFSVVVDAIFGFSFRVGGLSGTFKDIVSTLNACTSARIVAVDIPTGWSVDDGPPHHLPDQPWLSPDVLVSLTSPKKSAKLFTGAHYLGGRFIPPALDQEMQLNLPVYPGSSQTLRLH